MLSAAAIFSPQPERLGEAPNAVGPAPPEGGESGSHFHLRRSRPLKVPHNYVDQSGPLRSRNRACTFRDELAICPIWTPTSGTDEGSARDDAQPAHCCATEFDAKRRVLGNAQRAQKAVCL